MDKINKALLKLPSKQRQKLIQAFSLVIMGKVEGLNIKKLKGHTDLYRLRIGDTRLIYRHVSGKKPTVMYIGKRDDQTYRDF